ncbi:MAG: hypothetical protein ACXVEF_24290 [Polyangiales bacterium]
MDGSDGAAYAARLTKARAYPKPAGPPGKRWYPTHFAVPATIFWVGEPATKQNGCTANLASAFDHDWIGAYGGCDAASPRVTEDDGFHRPQGFVPKENPYYVALPYGSNEHAPWRDEVPWLDDRPRAHSVRAVLKNRWVAIRRDDVVCYAQWEDIGPFCVDDADYVFGGAAPRNDGVSCDTGSPGNGTASGIDLSPATASCLGATFELGLFPVDWWFVDDAFVPEGPWRRVITDSEVRDGPARPATACAQTKPYPSCG